MEKKKILLISSANPMVGPGAIGRSMYETIKSFGHDVDMLTKFKVESRPDIMYVYEKDSKQNDLKFRIANKIRNSPKGAYCFFYRKENQPPVSTTKILQCINKKYDIVIVYFWQELLSFETIDKIYDKLHCRFIFICADYSPMSGGCHFTGDCERYMTGCGCCPAFGSKDPNDFTRWNVEYRKKVYEKVRPAIWANTYMIESFFKKSYLLKNQKCIVGKGYMDLELFKQLPKGDIMIKYDIPRTKSFIISFGCQSLVDERKGMSYMIEALNIVYDEMTEEEREKTLLLSIGRDGEKIAPQLKLDYKDLGYINREELPSFYSVSDVFLSSSVNDAGPSTLKQALACGTPVVSFEMGAALDVLRGQGTGYCAQLRESRDLACGILKILRMSQEEYLELRNYCRAFIERNSSPSSFVKSIVNVV